MSVSRHRLWRLRDDIADKILEGGLSRSDAAVELLDRVEECIVHADKLTLWRMVLMPSPPREWVQSEEEDERKRMKQISSGEREAIESYHRWFDYYMAIHFFMSSPFGWIACIVLFVVIIPAVLVKKVWRRGRLHLQDVKKIVTSFHSSSPSLFWEAVANWSSHIFDGTADSRLNATLDRLSIDGKASLDSCAG